MTSERMMPVFDKSQFEQRPYSRRVEKPWGWELHWTPAEAPYMGKILHINEGARLSLQLHDEKRESWTLLDGRAAVIWEDKEGSLVQTELEMGQGYTCALGQRHRLVGLTECDVIEVSTPELGTTWRLEDDFQRPHETPEQREIERR
ncbi:MAG TPA: cupin [Dehalococcoidia bacterium]|nr:cupin [Dehalococcoidia bacterium]